MRHSSTEDCSYTIMLVDNERENNLQSHFVVLYRTTKCDCIFVLVSKGDLSVCLLLVLNVLEMLSFVSIDKTTLRRA